MTTKNKAEGWVIALIVIGVIFMVWGVFNWQKGLSLQELTPAEQKLTTAIEDAKQLLEVSERWHDGENYVNMGITMLVVGSIFIIGGGISLAIATRQKEEGTGPAAD